MIFKRFRAAPLDAQGLELGYDDAGLIAWVRDPEAGPAFELTLADRRRLWGEYIRWSAETVAVALDEFPLAAAVDHLRDPEHRAPLRYLLASADMNVGAASEAAR